MHELEKILLQHAGRENAISLNELADALQWSRGRVKEQIKKARSAQFLICSEQSAKNKTGYYIPANEDEAYSSVAKLEASATRKWKLAKAQKEAFLDQYKKHAEQLDFSDTEEEEEEEE